MDEFEEDEVGRQIVRGGFHRGIDREQVGLEGGEVGRGLVVGGAHRVGRLVD